MSQNIPNSTDWRSCTREDGTALMRFNGHRVPIGSSIAIIRMNCYAISDADQGLLYSVMLDFGSINADLPSANEEAAEVIKRLFPEFANSHCG
jgi:hypothetical protein